VGENHTLSKKNTKGDPGVLLKRIPADGWALLVVGAVFLCYGLGAYGLLNNNEGLYAEIAREMLERGSYGIPTLNGVPYIEKPPLLAWTLGAAYGIFGTSEWISRSIPAAFTGLSIVATVALVASARGGNAAWLSGLVLATSVFQVIVFRTLLPDVLFTGLFTASMLFFFRWHTGRKKTDLILCYALLGLSTLAKGFAPLVLAPLIFALFHLWTRPTWQLSNLLLRPALFLGLAIAAAWPVFLTLENPDFSWFFVVNEHVLRYLDLREPKDYYTGPMYYYAPRILLFGLPWTAFISLLVWPRTSSAGPVSDVGKLAWLWLGVCLAFFSLSQAKANYYMTLAMPALAILIGLRLDGAIRQGHRYHLVLLSAVLAACALLGLWAVGEKFWMQPPPTGIWRAVFRSRSDLRLALELSIVLAALAAIFFWLRHSRLALYAVALSGLPLLVFFIVVMERSDRWVSARTVAEYVKANYPFSKVYLFQDYETLSSAPFYLGRSLPVVDSASHDLAFGMRHRPDSGLFLSSKAFGDRLAREPVVLLVHRGRLAAFKATFGESVLTPRQRIGVVTVFTN
jgi:4-amino-4-deoxy-L-arabinose transferase-like glycosyltransferase